MGSGADVGIVVSADAGEMWHTASVSDKGSGSWGIDASAGKDTRDASTGTNENMSIK
jgi:hypothetical protein